MTLRQQQTIFLKNFAELIIWAFQNGYEATAGELHRPDELQELYLKSGKTKVKRGRHQDRMAGDLMLFKNGVYLKETKDYQPLGKKWCEMHPRNRWGGDWDKDGMIEDESFLDGNHFEMMLE